MKKLRIAERAWRTLQSRLSRLVFREGQRYVVAPLKHHVSDRRHPRAVGLIAITQQSEQPLSAMRKGKCRRHTLLPSPQRGSAGGYCEVGFSSPTPISTVDIRPMHSANAAAVLIVSPVKRC